MCAYRAIVDGSKILRVENCAETIKSPAIALDLDVHSGRLQRGY